MVDKLSSQYMVVLFLLQGKVFQQQQDCQEVGHRAVVPMMEDNQGLGVLMVDSYLEKLLSEAHSLSLEDSLVVVEKD